MRNSMFFFRQYTSVTSILSVAVENERSKFLAVYLLPMNVLYDSFLADFLWKLDSADPFP